MNPPDQRAFEADLQEAEFRIGVTKGLWGLAEANFLGGNISWPKVVFWVSASERPNAPARFYTLLDCSGYRGASPTGTFWDPQTKQLMTLQKRPKGKTGSRVAQVFRTDWNNGNAFYHPYDRVAAQTHPAWSREYPHLVWSPTCTIADFLQLVLHDLLKSEDYAGV